MDAQSTKDEYLWLEDLHNPQTPRWLAKQSVLLQKALSSRFRPMIRNMVEALVCRAAIQTPVEAGGRLFFCRRGDRENYATLYVRDDTGLETPLATPSAFGDRFCSLTVYGVSLDGARVAICVRGDGRDEAVTKVISVTDGAVLAEHLPPFKKNRTVLSADLTGFYYVEHQAGHGCWVCYQRVDERRQRGGQRLWYLNVDEPESVLIQPLTNGRDALLHVIVDRRRTPVDHYLAKAQSSEPLCFWKGFEHKTFFLEDCGDVYVLTDWNAPQGRVLKSSVDKIVNWREVVPELDSVITHYSIVSGHLFLGCFQESSMELRIYDGEGRLKYTPELPGAGTVSPATGVGHAKCAYYEFTRATSPSVIFQFDIPSGTQRIWWTADMPKGLAVGVESREVRYRSKDGTDVPVILMCRKGAQINSDTPAILTAYGGFGMSQTPSLSNRMALWIALGGLYAYAYIRGGGEFGEGWHRAGMRENKQNSFDDFIAAAVGLVSDGYTRPERLAIVGGSNSGLLVGAALTQRPDLFAAVICFGPILDMLRYHLFPGGEIGLLEYGCAANSADGEYLRAYSPYHNVKEGTQYPAVLFISGDADTRCHPMHALKMTARLQTASVSKRPILLDYHEKRGHATLLPLAERVETLTNQFCFLAEQLNLAIRPNEPCRTSGFNEKSDAPGDCSQLAVEGAHF
jgi:prolyl oligopeptidase